MKERRNAVWPFDRKIKKAAQKLGIEDLGPVLDEPRIHIWCISYIRNGKRLNDDVRVRWCPKCLIAKECKDKK